MNFSQKARKGRISLGIFLPHGLVFVGGVLSPKVAIMVQSLCRVRFHSCMWPNLHEYAQSKAYPCRSATSYQCNPGSGARMLLQLKGGSFYTSPAEVVA